MNPLQFVTVKNKNMRDIKLFESKKVRSQWSEEDQKWYFSIVDVVAILTDSPDARNYWKVLKHRLTKEGNESVTNCNQLKMQSADGKFYKTDVGDVEQLLRLIQSIPSPKAEPFKQWLREARNEVAKVPSWIEGKRFVLFNHGL